MLTEEVYWAECYACETHIQVTVFDNDEPPCFCPMCGSPIEYEDSEE